MVLIILWYHLFRIAFLIMKFLIQIYQFLINIRPIKTRLRSIDRRYYTYIILIAHLQPFTMP